ncbi:DUF1320 domain-containing protein [Shewanella sp. AS1]|uniref:gp436 family protein n=1 Tax=Shewanella sp. AS1 TaxID=2907626 RepID=UPI001F347E85|nr:DUF1320 domain-containing protein [Shewanella sp. AS1]MCE9679613.1 DUF1320 domain-containing protein [Shewanella sp. AS1]
MPYATAEQMIARFGEQELIALTDRDGTAGGVVMTVLDTAIADASAIIDGYLAGRYALPLANPLPVLARLCCDMARYGLYDDAVSDAVAKRNDDAVRFLEKVAQGSITLGVSSEGAQAVPQDMPEIHSAGSVFARPSSKGFI